MAYDTFTNQKESREKGTGRHLNLQINLAKVEAVRRKSKERAWSRKERGEEGGLKRLWWEQDERMGRGMGQGRRGKGKEEGRKEVPGWRERGEAVGVREWVDGLGNRQEGIR